MHLRRLVLLACGRMPSSATSSVALDYSAYHPEVWHRLQLFRNAVYVGWGKVTHVDANSLPFARSGRCLRCTSHHFAVRPKTVPWHVHDAVLVSVLWFWLFPLLPHTVVRHGSLCNGFLALASHMREAMVRMMTAAAPRQRPDVGGDWNETGRLDAIVRREDGSKTSEWTQLTMNPSTSTFWCAIALGAIAKGCPLESVRSGFSL